METKILLSEEDIPRKWYNVLADFKTPMDPGINPATMEPLKPSDLEAIFAKELIRQEMSSERFIPIPEEVRDIYRLWRPTPMYRARRLEEKLKTPVQIYYKYEGVSPAGSHKANSSIPQAYYNMKQGLERISTETGAGQWGSALALATTFFDLECTVYMVKVSYEQKPYRRILMETWGAECLPSPTDRTEAGRKMREMYPGSSGSLGMAISEAVEDAATHENTNYCLGSVLNHVLLHQTVIGEEARKQFELIDAYPDAVYGCVGGGSNFPGLALPFVRDKLSGKKPELDVVACEPEACPTLTKGLFAYDFGDTARLTPIRKRHTLGHDFVPAPIHAGGLRYHGDAPILSKLVADNYVRAEAFHQNEVFEAATLFARTEGILIAPESAHALRAVVNEALRCKESGEAKKILFIVSGHGHFDLSSYDKYNRGELVDYEYPAELIAQSLKNLPPV